MACYYVIGHQSRRGHGISSDNGTSSSALSISHIGAQLWVMRLTGQTLNTGWVGQALSTPLCIQNMVSPLWFSVFVLYFFSTKLDAYLSVSLCLNSFCSILGFLQFVFKLGRLYPRLTSSLLCSLRWH